MRTALKTLIVSLAVVAGFAAARGPDIVLPDGTTCKPVDPAIGATVADGKVSHFCQDGVALVGTTQLVDDQGLVTRIEYDPAAPATILSDALVGFEVRGVTLADGTTCLNAGKGATLAFLGERVNFTCDDDAVILGYFDWDGATLLATKGVVKYSEADGFTLAGHERMEVSVLDGSAYIVGSEWRLASFGPNGTAALPDHEITLEIKDGQVAGSAGCNRYFAPVTFGVAGGVTFGPAGATMMFCEGAMEQEQRYLTALALVDDYSITPDDELVLTGGGETLVFRR